MTTKTIDEIARGCVTEMMHSHDPREAIIGKAIRSALGQYGTPLRDLLEEMAGALGGAAEGSEEEAQLARIGAALAAWDEEMG